MSHRQAGGTDQQQRTEWAREVGLFRYALIRQVADPGLSPRERGPLVRALAEQEHTGPFGGRVRYSRVTLDRWVRHWRTGGFDALVPSSRHAQPRTPAAVLDLAAALKREVPARTAAQVAAILAEHLQGGAAALPSARTLQRHFARLELNTRPDGSPPKAFGRFEAAAVNERWTGDALHGPVIAGRKTYLFAFIDDHSRALTGYRWGHSEDTVRLEAALRAGLAARGIPQVVYLDNGSAMVSIQLLRAMAVLGIRLTHSKPGQPQGRGKIERFFRTVREQFLVELAAPGALANIDGLTRLNELFTGWVETIYHQRVHSETGQPPIERFLACGAPPVPTAAVLREAFLWSEHRQVTKTATVSLHGNTYQVDAALTGRRVELVFDPFDLSELTVRYDGRDMGAAIGHHIGRHVHPTAKPDTAPEPAPTTGIDYLNLIHARHTTALSRTVDYATLAARDTTTNTSTGAPAGQASARAEPDRHLPEQVPGQLDLLTLIDTPAPNPTDVDTPDLERTDPKEGS
jgi:putative transposase